jgi:RNA polymerase sigma factor (sigma-70 family)
MVYVIDDDPSVRDAIQNLLESVGLPSQVFGSTQEFSRTHRVEEPSCLILDVRLPGKNGLEFQAGLRKEEVFLPIIFITAHGDVPMTSRAMKAGAIEFLMKPFQKEELLAAVRHGLERDQHRRREQAEIDEFQTRFEQLTPREREVMALVVTGRTNKEIGVDLGLSEVTVKIHRSRMMQKMQVSSVAELVRIAYKLHPPF